MEVVTRIDGNPVRYLFAGFKNVPFGEYYHAEDYARLLSLLTPPPDAAVRQAVEMFDIHLLEGSGHKEDRALLTLLRAVQAPRLTEEQVKEAYLNGYEDGNEDGRALTGCRNVYEHTPRHDPDTAWAKSDTRAAFPELAGEVKRG